MVTVRADQAVASPAVLSYQATLPSCSEAETGSSSPSRSRSSAAAPTAPLAAVEMGGGAAKHAVAWMVSLRYHCTWFAPPSTSRSPSPSMSAGHTEYARVAAVVIVRVVHAEPSPFTFSYHAILLGLTDAESASMSPSPSTSPAITDSMRGIPVAMVPVLQTPPWPSTFRYQVIFWLA